jgi:hypothetical protein
MMETVQARHIDHGRLTAYHFSSSVAKHKLWEPAAEEAHHQH